LFLRRRLSNVPLMTIQAPRHQRQLTVLRGALACCAVVLLAITTRGNTTSSLTPLAQMVQGRLAAWKDSEKALATPDSGRETLPPAITAAVAMVKASGNATFSLSPGVRADGFLHQRVSEVAWPLAVALESDVVLRLADEAPSTSCVLLSESAGVAVDRCN
jgi:hypothetical protein